MVKNEELFSLIHSLSKSEKRYFKLFCAGQSNYVRLFNAIEKQQVYNEKEIKRKFRNEKFIKQLHVTKNYLRGLILKSLRDFYGNISKDAELKETLRNVELLFNKELYTHCETELKKAHSLATKYELNTGLVEVYGWQRKLEQATRPHNYKGFTEAIKAQNEALALLQNSNIYWKLAVSITQSVLKNQKQINSKLLNNPENALTLEAKVLHYNTNYVRYMGEGKIEKAQAGLYTLIGILEAHPFQLRSNPASYISTINNLASYLIYQKSIKEAVALINKAKTAYENFRITTENKSVLKQVLRTYNLELEIYRDKKLFNAQPAFVDNTEKFITANRNKIPKEYLISFWFQLAHIYFMKKDFDSSLKWINQILNMRFDDIRIDLQVQARMLNLIIHLEQQNLFVLRYFVDSAKRFLKKKKDIELYENILLKFFMKIAAAPLLEYKQQFKELYNQLFPAGKQAVIPPAILDYINYKDWIKAKISISKWQSYPAASP